MKTAHGYWNSWAVFHLGYRFGKMIGSGMVVVPLSLELAVVRPAPPYCTRRARVATPEVSPSVHSAQLEGMVSGVTVLDWA